MIFYNYKKYGLYQTDLGDEYFPHPYREQRYNLTFSDELIAQVDTLV